jgi:hypothetical protein
MATRKSGDESRDASASGDRPGSYKLSGSRRKKKAQKRASERPAAKSSAPAPSEPSRASAAVGGSERERSDDANASGVRATEADEPTQTDAGANSVDDLRPSKPQSSRAPRRPLGPLGMHDATAPQAATEPVRSTPSSTSSPSRRNVVEINAPGVSPTSVEAGEPPRDRGDDEPAQAAAEPINHDRAAPVGVWSGRAHEQQDDVFEDALEFRVPSGSFAHASDESHEAGSVHQGAYDPRAAHARPAAPLPSAAPDFAAPLAPHYQASSVLDARPSFNPSSKPSLAQDSSRGLWLAVAILCAIIAAAGVIAVRDALRAASAQRAVAPSAEPRALAPEPPSRASPAQVAPAPPLPSTRPPAEPVPQADPGNTTPPPGQAAIGLDPRASLERPGTARAATSSSPPATRPRPLPARPSPQAAASAPEAAPSARVAPAPAIEPAPLATPAGTSVPAPAAAPDVLPLNPYEAEP